MAADPPRAYIEDLRETIARLERERALDEQTIGMLRRAFETAYEQRDLMGANAARMRLAIEAAFEVFTPGVNWTGEGGMAEISATNLDSTLMNKMADVLEGLWATRILDEGWRPNSAEFQRERDAAGMEDAVKRAEEALAGAETEACDHNFPARETTAGMRCHGCSEIVRAETGEAGADGGAR